MKRRDFLKTSSALSLPVVLNGFPISATAATPLLNLLREQTANNGKVLVLIQLNGGNDGLNTLIPLDQYSQLMNARPNIIIPASKVLPLKNMPQTGIHPAMAGTQAMYNNGQMNIVQAVSYPNPNYSHFRAADILLSGSASDVYLNSGWLGRNLETLNPVYPPVDHPAHTALDPLAIQIGSQTSLVTQSSTINLAVTVTDPTNFYELISGGSGDTPDTPYGHELKFIRLIKQQTSDYTLAIQNAYKNGKSNTTNYSDSNSLAQQFKIVARLIKGGLTTPVYVVNHPESFDSHANQVEISDTTTGRHATLLATLSEAVSTFQQDLINMGVSNRVAAMTFTEFGRRIKSNDSMGSDHGMATPIFFFGTNLNPAIIGRNPVIPSNIKDTDQVNMQYDFRAVYYTVMKDWFGLTADQLSSVLPDAYTTLPIFKQIALPVQLLSFTGNWATDKVVLKWQVDQEINIDQYEIQRSDDGINFQKIGTSNATNTAVPYTYTYNDLNLSKSLYYYRIKIIETTGATEFSSVILLKKNQASAGMRIKVYPNPVTDSFKVLFEDKISGQVTARITDLNGKEIWKQEKNVNAIYDLGFSFGNRKPVGGIYILRLEAKNDEAIIKILIQ